MRLCTFSLARVNRTMAEIQYIRERHCAQFSKQTTVLTCGNVQSPKLYNNTIYLSRSSDKISGGGIFWLYFGLAYLM